MKYIENDGKTVIGISVRTRFEYHIINGTKLIINAAINPYRLLRIIVQRDMLQQVTVNKRTRIVLVQKL